MQGGKLMEDLQENIVGVQIVEYTEIEKDQEDLMTKDAKNIVKKDIKKYTELAEYTRDKENVESYIKIVNFLNKIIENQEVQKIEIHKRRYRKDVKRTSKK